MKQSYQDYYRKNRRQKRSLLAILLLPITFPLGLISNAIRGTASAASGGSRLLSATSLARFAHWLVLQPFMIGRSIVSSFWLLLSSWTATRERKALLYGMPALIFAVLTLSLVLFNEYYMKRNLLSKYEVASKQAIKLEEYDSAMIYLEKLLELDEDEDEYRFQMADVYYRQGNSERGTAMLNHLAPIDRAGYPKAHVLVSRLVLGQANDENREQMIALARTHLEHAILRDPRNIEALQVAAHLAAKTGRPKDAARYMESAAMQNSDLLLDAAVLKRANDQDQDARLLAQAFIDHTSKTLELQPLKRWTRVSRAFFFLERYPETVDAVQRAIRSTTNENEVKALKSGLAEAHTSWGKSIEGFRDNASLFAERLSHLDAALQIDPKYQPALLLLAEMAFVDSDHSDQVNNLLRNALVNGQATATVHMLLGTSAIHAGKVDTALVHLKQAQELAPNTVEILNNLAWLHAHREEPDLAVASELIESATAIAKDNFHIRHTRGTILLKSGKLKEALVDLEFALPLMRNNVTLHEQLSEIYAKLGQLELSVKHDSEAKRLREKAGL